MYKSFPGNTDKSRNIVFLDIFAITVSETFVELERKEWCIKTSRFELEELMNGISCILSLFVSEDMGYSTIF